MKKLLVALALGLYILNFTACTSNSSSEDQEVAAEDSESLDAQLEGEETTDKEKTASNDQFIDEQLSGSSNSSDSQEKPTETAAAPPAPAESTPAIESVPNTAAVDPGAEKQTFVESPIAEHVASLDPLHFKSTPFKVDGKILNAVYVFRPKDSFLKISKNIYGNEKHVSDLKKWNVDIKNPQPGDKIYYNSPSRPDDESRMLTFFEDSGVVPDVYITKDGENLKGISKQLLGYKNAWKEVYATNNLSSQDSLPAGTEIRYWKGSFISADTSVTNQSSFSEVAATPVKKAKKQKTKKFKPVDSNNSDFASAPPPMDLPPPPPIESTPPPAPPTMAQNDMPPPPPVANTQPSDLPPPPPVEAAPPVADAAPAVPPVAENPKTEEPPPVIEEASDDLMYYYAGGGLALIGVLGFVIARKKKQQQEMANAFNNDVPPSA
jgi:hypothetical protein